MTSIHWYNMGDGYPLGSYDTDTSGATYLCPICGAATVYWEGQIDETPQGLEVYGWRCDCYACAIHSEIEEIEPEDYPSFWVDNDE